MNTIRLFLIISLFLLCAKLYSQTDEDINTVIKLAERGYGSADFYKLDRILNKHPQLRTLTDEEGNNLILIAAKHANISFFSALEDVYGFDPYSVNAKGQNALSVHIVGARIGVTIPFMEWLLKEYGADKLVNSPDNDGVYPIMHAVDKKYLYLIKELHEKYGAKLEIADNNGVTLAMRVAALGDTTNIRYLASKGVKFSPVDKEGRNAAWYAKVRGLRHQLGWEIESLIEKEARLHQIDKLNFEKARVSMMIKQLVINGDVQMLKDFIAGLKGEDNPIKGLAWTNFKYEHDRTLMHIAADAGRIDMMEYLYSMDPSLLIIKDDHNKTPRDMVDISTNLAVVEFLKDPAKNVREKIMNMDMAQDKKDLIFNLQRYCSTLPTSDLDILSAAFISKILAEGLGQEADELLFGIDEGLFDTYGLYDYWMENLNSGDNCNYALMVGALVFGSGTNVRRVSASTVRKGYKVILGSVFEEALGNRAKLDRAVDIYGPLVPGLNKSMNKLLIELYNRPIIKQ